MRKHRILPGLLVLACVLGTARSAFGWGAEGHAIVATIADLRLTPAARAGVEELLGSQTMPQVASWADSIRSQRSETAPWHYVDIPTDADKFDEARDGQNGNNVIDAINKFIPIMSDPSKPKSDRTEALKFVIHFVGDLHQPLHCAERNKDKGGNARLVFLLDQPRAQNLHSIWDSGILRLSMGNTTIPVYAAALNARISSAQATEWAAGTPEDWANQSHRIAVEHTYKNVPADGPPPKLTQAYVDENGPIIDQQLSRAGVRLAMVLNNAFANTPATLPSASTQPTK